MQKILHMIGVTWVAIWLVAIGIVPVQAQTYHIGGLLFTVGHHDPTKRVHPPLEKTFLAMRDNYSVTDEASSRAFFYHVHPFIPENQLVQLRTTQHVRQNEDVGASTVPFVVEELHKREEGSYQEDDQQEVLENDDEEQQGQQEQEQEQEQEQGYNQEEQEQEQEQTQGQEIKNTDVQEDISQHDVQHTMQGDDILPGGKVPTQNGDDSVDDDTSQQIEQKDAVIILPHPGDGVRVRRAPSTSAQQIGYVYAGEKHTVIEKRYGWYHILRENGNDGWISGVYATPVS